MADDSIIRCESILYSEETGTPTTVFYCWEETTPYVGWQPENVDVGLRPSITENARAWRTCQYFLTLPPMCTHWNASFRTCEYIENSQVEGQPRENLPTGYNNAQCDYLGRRIWCDKYEPRGGDISALERVCAAPNMFLTGLGTMGDGTTIGGDNVRIILPLHPDDITGYNPTDDNVGQCDCYGMGRGAEGCAIIGITRDAAGNESAPSNSDIEDLLSEEPVRCNYYRPYSMSFGGKQPQRVPRALLNRGLLDPTDPLLDDYEDEGMAGDYFVERLPINFLVYNLRANLQRCQWWANDLGAEFALVTRDEVINPEAPVEQQETVRETKIRFAEEAAGIQPFDPETGDLLYCTNPDADIYDYKTLYFPPNTPYDELPGTLTQHVLAWNGIICNGARPECPGYSGKWVYCVDEKMRGGMAVTAEQIMELRFWVNDFEDQNVYESYFSEKPNRTLTDPPTTAIYTFDRWVKESGGETSDSRMAGKKLDLCVPIPYNARDFSRAVRIQVLQKEEITYAPPFITPGTAAENMVSFPCLIRSPYVGRIAVLEVIYPYRNDDVWEQVPCDPYPQGSWHTRYHYKPDGMRLSVVGWTTPNRVVYAINSSFTSLTSEETEGFSSFTLSNFVGARSSLALNEAERLEYSRRLSSFIDDLEASNAEYVVKTVSNPELGSFVIDSLKLPYGFNKILVIVANSDGTYDFRARTVYAAWAGAGVIQKTFDDNEPESPTRFPFTFSPSATILVRPTSFSNYVSPALNTMPVYHDTAWISGQTYRYYSYYIKKETVTCTPTNRFMAVGNSNLVLVDCNDYDINILFDDYEVVSASIRTERFGDVSMKKVDISRISLPPGVVVLEPIDSNIRIRFLPSDVLSVSIIFSTSKFVSGDPGLESEDVEIIAGAGSSEFDLYRACPYSIEEINPAEIDETEEGGDSAGRVGDLVISGITNTAARILTIGVAGGKPVCAFATKLLTKLADIRCRNVDILYRYGAYTQAAYVLTPTTGFCIPPLGIEPYATTLHIIETPRCADHEYSDLKFVGPLWYPFNNCQRINMYKEFTGANFCTASYVGPENDALIGTMPFVSVLGGTYQIQMRNDYRYCGPHQYVAWAESRSALQACGCGWAFYYADAAGSTVHFMGKARIRGPIDAEYFREEGWDLPPFGNDGTELVEKFVSQDHLTHFTGTIPPTRSEWMPMVMDHSQFVVSFNAFEDLDVNIDYALGNNKGSAGLVFTSMINFFTLPEVGETPPDGDIALDTGDARYSFDELFDVEYEGNSSYPPPTVQITDDSTANNFYKFKNENTCWAWQEYWVPPQRISGNLNIVSKVYLPPYMYSLFKEENRMSPDEGTYQLSFFPSGASAAIGAPAGVYGSMKFGDGPARSFKMIYGAMDPETGLYDYDASLYNNTQVEWVSLSSESNPSDSSNAPEDAVEDPSEDDINDMIQDNPDEFYSMVSADDSYIFGDLTIDDFPEDNYMNYVLFTDDAGDREIITDYDYEADPKETIKKYKRHVKINIPRNRLDFLPREETPLYFFGVAVYNTYTLGSYVLDTDQIPNEVASPEVREAVGTDYIWGPLESNLLFVPVDFTGGTANGPYIGRIKLKGKWGLIDDPRGINPSERFETIKIDKPGINFVYSAAYSQDFIANNPSLTGQEARTGQIPRGWSASVATPETPSETAQFGLEDYEIDIRLPVGPIELTTGMLSFVFSLSCAADSYIAFDELILYAYEGPITASETINIYERKYRISTFNQSPSLDGPQDLLHYHQDLHRSGQYFKFKGRLYDPEDMIVTANKLRSVAAGPYYEDDQPISVSMDNLKEVEKEVQKDLYEYAANLFGAGQGEAQESTVYEAYQLPAIKPIGIRSLSFVEEARPEAGGFTITVPVKLTMKVTRIPWDEHYLQESFVQYDFWRPGGHSYSWSTFATNELCSTNGQRGLTFYGAFNHHGHTGINAPGAPADIGVDTSRSYYSTRFYATEALYQRFLILSGGREPDAGFDLLTAANVYNTGRTPGGNRL